MDMGEREEEGEKGEQGSSGENMKLAMGRSRGDSWAGAAVTRVTGSAAGQLLDSRGSAAPGQYSDPGPHLGLLAAWLDSTWQEVARQPLASTWHLAPPAPHS